MLNNASYNRSVVIRGVASALLALAACSVFEIPADGFIDERFKPDASAGGASGTSGGNAGTDGSGGAQGTAGNQGSGGVVGSGGRGGSGGSSGINDAGSNQPWWPYINEDMCQSAGVPSGDDRRDGEPGESLPPIYMVVSRIRLGTAKDDATLTPDRNAWQDIGFDLDKTCTASSTCLDPLQEPIYKVACQHPSAQRPYDGKQCRDNELSKLFKLAADSPSIGEWFGMTEADWNCELHRGGWGNMLKISDYNGKKNDANVRLDLYSTLGLRVPPTWFCREEIDKPLATNWTTRVSWRTDEHWKIDAASIALGAPDSGTELPNAEVYDPAAFVRNGYLFARLPDNSKFGLNGTNTKIHGFGVNLYRGILVGELVKEVDDTWSIANGTIGGVVRIDHLLQSFRAMGFCENLCKSYDQVRDYLNTYRDALTISSTSSPDIPCDGLSFAEDFRARQATASKQDIVDVSPPTVCPDPRHPDAPRQGCTCPDGGGRCELRDGGT